MKTVTKIIALLVLAYCASIEQSYAQDAQSVALIQPQETDILKSGMMNRIAWQATNVENIKLEWKDINATTWELVGIYAADHDGYKNDDNSIGSLAPWVVPAAPSNKAQLRISAEDDPSVSAMMSYTLKNEPKLTIIQPKPYQKIEGGQLVRIAWQAEGIENIAIEYKDTAMGGWQAIEASYPAAEGHYELWSAPKTMSGVIWIRLRAVDNPAVTAQISFTLENASSAEPEIAIPGLTITGENPVAKNSSWTISFPEGKIGSYKLLDITGAILKENSSVTNENISFEGIASGMYVLQCEMNGIMASKQIIIAK